MKPVILVFDSCILLLKHFFMFFSSYQMGSIKGVRRGRYATKSNQENQTSCGQCNRIYKRKHSLAHHIRTTHSNYSVECPICKIKLTSVSVRNRHLKNVHSAKSANAIPTANEQPFVGQKPFPQISNVLSFKENRKYGKYIVANTDIDVGKVVAMASPFVSVEYLSSMDQRCFECGKAKDINFIECGHCIDLWFCSKQCSQSEIHRLKCNTNFSRNDCHIVRLATELIKVALHKAPDMNTFADFCSEILFFGKSAEHFSPPFSCYGEILQLKGFASESNMDKARRIARYIMQIPEFNGMDLQHLRRLIFHLAHRHTSTIEMNAFSEQKTVSEGGICTRYFIYDALSRLNHSCDPNIQHFTDDNDVTNCIVIRQIKSGEQCFINYLGGMEFETTEMRQNYIKKHWNFECKCEKCSAHVN